MKGGVIAAGWGERLRAGGITTPKPLVRVGGVPLIERVLTAMRDAGIGPIAMITNEEFDGVEEHVRGLGFPVTVVRKTTPSSMESFFALAPHLRDGRFFLSTVDAIYDAPTLKDFLAAAERAGGDGTLAVTDPDDDEKPLHVHSNPDGRITKIGGPPAPQITAGYYALSPTIFEETAAARRAAYTGLRGFLGHLVDRGYRLHAARVPATVDVDRPADIAAAERRLGGTR